MHLGSWIGRGGLALWLLLGAACKDEGSDAPASGGGKGGRVTTGSTSKPMDAGNAGGEEVDEDGGTTVIPPGDPLITECLNIDPATFTESETGDFNTAIAPPADLVITRVLATWDRGCSPPTILLELSGGECRKSDGHALQFYVDAQSIVDGTFGEGLNTIAPEPSPSAVRVRYTRPERLEPEGTWGSCAGSNGTLSIRGMLDANKLREVQGMFQLELTPCDELAEGTQLINGTFNIEMKRSLEDVCPPR